MADTARQTKRQRQRVAAEGRATARRRRELRRTIASLLGGVALVAVAVVGVLALMGDEGGSVGPSPPGQVVVAGAARAQPLVPGDAVPDFSAPGIGGGTVSWGDYEGGPAVLSVWAPWCPHCQVELPVLDRVVSEFPGVALVTIVTAIDAQPGPSPDAYLEENGLSFPTAIDDSAGTLSDAFGIRAFPTIFFVSSDGTVVRSAEGEVDEDALRQMIASLS